LVDVELNTSSSKAEQDCKAILLHENATMNAKPEMKIFNDDVVCKHGTTIGTLDKEQIFYLQSRGLDKISAEKILLQGIIKNYISDESPLSSFLPKVYQ
jgi:Fe-S cluster assembly protein SufD